MWQRARVSTMTRSVGVTALTVGAATSHLAANPQVCLSEWREWICSVDFFPQAVASFSPKHFSLFVKALSREIASPLFYSHRAEPREGSDQKDTFLYLYFCFSYSDAAKYNRSHHLRWVKPETKIWNHQSSTAIKHP